jgi:tryptophan 7-halogenase
MTDSIKNILIVGGGTSGWITAAFLNRFLDPARCRITLVESATVGTIGVGEATVPPLVPLLRMLGIAEDDFLRQCHATYKLGIKFVDWNRGAEGVGKDEIWHPFGPIGAPVVENLPLFHHWLRDKREGRETGAYTAYSLQASLGDMNKAPRGLQTGSVVMSTGAYAYHLDAKAFAGYLAALATRRGVVHMVDDVVAAPLDARGFVSCVETAAHGKLVADLYIDCSGFAGLLIERALGDPHVDWSNHLLCDRAVVMPLPAEPSMPPYTRATALNAGWAWKIPLSNRTGTGYVYSSRFIAEDAAARELIAVHRQDPDKSTPSQLRMRVGRRANFWVKNCVSIGLAAGFLEPLESTGLFLVQKGVELLLDYFPDAEFNGALIRRYNEQMGTEFAQVRDFIVLHYLLNRRQDSEFWKTSREAAPPESLAQTMDFYHQTGQLDWTSTSLFREPSFHAIVSGFDRLPRTPHSMAAQIDVAKSRQIMADIKAKNLEIARASPDHRALIEAINAAGNAPAR